MIRPLGLLLVLLNACPLLSQPETIDSLERLLPTLKGSQRVTALGDLCFYLSNVDVARAEKYGREALDMAVRLEDSALVASAANDLSTCLFRKCDLDGALAYSYRALAIRRKSGDRKAIASSLNKLVNIYNERVMLDSSLNYALETVKIFEEARDSNSWAIALSAVASVFFMERDWAACKRYAAEAYRIATACRQPYAIAGSAGNLALAEEQAGNFDAALSWYNIALENYELVGSLIDVSTVAGNLGVLYSRQGRKEEALASYKKALQMARAIGELKGIAHFEANIGTFYATLGDLHQAEMHLTAASEVSGFHSMGRTRMQVYESLAEVYARTGRGERAVAMMQQYRSLRDSLYNTERSEQLQEMRTRYETEKKEQENRLLQSENRLKQQENRFLLAGSGIVIALLSISGWLYYRSYRRKQENRLQAILVREREAGLLAVIEAAEQERKRIARDLHDGIGQQLGALKLRWESLKEALAEHPAEEKKALHQLTTALDETAADVRTLSHQMMPRTLEENGLLPAIEDVLEKSLSASGITFRLEHFRVEDRRFPERVELGVYRVFQELVSNIVRHSAATEVSVQLYTNQQRLILVVEDNGCGFGSAGKKEGIGMLNITSRITTLKGEISWQPSPDKGTVAAVRIPITSTAA